MKASTLTAVVQHLRDLGGLEAEPSTDRQLLLRFAADRDGAAFAVLVARHGPMVLGVCRRLLGDAHAAEDAFQAVFLVLSRKAATVAWRDSAGPWLHDVAHRVAGKIKVGAARRARRESTAARCHADQRQEPRTTDALAVAVEEEVGRLPEKYRAPVVLCYLEGQTNEAAAAHLCWPIGTVAGRLARARDLLRRRLVRRGLAPLLLLAPAALTPTLTAATLRAVDDFTTGLAPSVAGSLAHGVLSAMRISRCIWITLVLACVGLLGHGVVLVGLQAQGKEAGVVVGEVKPPPTAPGEGKPPPEEEKVSKPLRILLFAGGPTRDYQFLRRLLVNEVDKGRVSLSICLQAERPEAERNQDVPADHLLKAFPDKLDPAKDGAADGNLANLANYDVVVAFDPDWQRVPHESLDHLKDWVDKQGGGLILIAGPISTYKLTVKELEKHVAPLLDLCPVQLLDARTVQAPAGFNTTPHRLRFPGAAKDTEFLRLASEKKEPTAGWEEFFTGLEKVPEDGPGKPLRGFYDCYPADGLKRNARLVAEFAEGGEKADGGGKTMHPYLVTMPVGRGRVVYLGSGETWRLNTFRNAYYERFWTLLGRYAAGRPAEESKKE
jgi:RNA polymerase sigma factor (sigma-70 family)